MGRGVSAIRIHPDKTAEAEKAITRDDVRKLVSSGGIYALKEKHNISMRSVILKKKREQGRRRGRGRKKGTVKARGGVDYQKRIRGQRRVLLKLKKDGTLDNLMFKNFYRLVKGGGFANKASLISHMRGKGVSMTEEKVKELRHV
jgi:large subunit ribosomal protein L19e